MCAVTTAAALAAIGTGYSLFGGASYVMPGHASNRAVELVADIGNAGTADDYSGVDFGVSSGLTLADIQHLSTEFMFTTGSCLGGSPRFQINVVEPVTNTVKNIHVYIGPPPNYMGCPANVWQDSGNLLAPANLIDTSQLPGGGFYDPVAAALVKFGAYRVTGIQIVSDTFSAAQTVVVDNVVIDDRTYTFEPDSKDDCKKGGWQNFTNPPGPFKNQGDCVSYFATGGKH